VTRKEDEEFSYETTLEAVFMQNSSGLVACEAAEQSEENKEFTNNKYVYVKGTQ